MYSFANLHTYRRAQVKDTISAVNSVALYETIDPPVSVKTVARVHRIAPPLPPVQNSCDIEMEECLAYGVVRK